MLKEFKPETFTSIFTVIFTGISVLSTILINRKSLKLPQVIDTSKLLIEEVFSFGLLHLETNLYLPLTFSIQKDLINFRKHSKKYLIYFDREFVRVLNNICDANYSNEAEFANNFQADYEKFSKLYLQTLNASRKNLGLTKYKYDFRIKNSLYFNPKTSKRLEKIDTALYISFMGSLLVFAISITLFPRFTHDLFTLMFLLGYILFLFRGAVY